MLELKSRNTTAAYRLRQLYEDIIRRQHRPYTLFLTPSHEYATPSMQCKPSAIRYRHYLACRATLDYSRRCFSLLFI